MACRVLERRRLRGKTAACGVRNLLSPSWTNDKARDTRTLLEMPTKVRNSQGMSRPDRIAIGKAIVDRPGKDDFWVTNNTAGWTFAAATREVPEDCPTRVDVNKLRKVSRGVSRQGASCQRTSSAAGRRGRSRQAQTPGVSGLIGTRELALLESHYRMAQAECRAEKAGGLSPADPGGDRRYRRPKTGKSENPACSAPSDLNASDFNLSEAEHSEGDGFYRGERAETGVTPAVDPRSPSFEATGTAGRAAAYGSDDEFASRGGVAKWGHRREENGATGAPKRLRQPADVRKTDPSRRNPAARSQSSPPRSDSGTNRHNTTAGTASPPRLGKSGLRSNGRRDADDNSPRGVRGGKLTPQPLHMGRAGGPRRESEEAHGEKMGGVGVGGVVKLHRGVVISDELRKELLNPLAHHRFKLLRGAH